MQWQRSELGNAHRLEIYECPIRVLDALARAAGTHVTVENISPVRATDQWFESALTIQPGEPARRTLIRNASFDAALDNREFLDLMPFWDGAGVYAVFTEKSPLAFQASRLPVPARYRALENFGFVLEFALAGPSGGDWSEIVSPRIELIELAESILKESPDPA